MHNILFAIAALSFLAFVWFGFVSINEKENRAACLSFILALCISLLILLFVLAIKNVPVYISACLLSLIAVFLFTILIPLKFPFKISKEQPTDQFDERNTIFSRLELTRRPELQNEYYSDNPDKFELDKVWLSKPGLMSEKAAMFNPFTFKAANASFFPIEQLRPFVNGEVNKEKTVSSAEKTSLFIKNWALKLGAVSVGICKLQNYHYYSIGGRGTRYNKTIEPKHKFGIAITVEMDKELLSMGPAGPTLMESAREYTQSGIIAIQLAKFIRNMGFDARAHIDGNYEVVCPTVARDAGLGEIGRMGLLMTPELGPRVRIAVVTTNIPLIPNKRKPDYTTHNFCRICKKCAHICPSQAIPHTDIQENNGVQKWQINHEKCFSYWCTTGTDCGRCMSICPYSHPNNTLHNFVRWGIKNNIVFRHLALKMDDFFYGKKPKPKKEPDYMKF